jgi:hypothetical protein
MPEPASPDVPATAPLDPNDPGGLPPEINGRVAHSARVYDYWLGGKDNISQVLSGLPYSGQTVKIQAPHSNISKFVSVAVRCLSSPCMGFMSGFLGSPS